MTLEGRVIVVTGGGRGIGREIGLAAARQGARVAVVDNGASVDGIGRDAQPAEEAAQAIQDAGGEAMALAIDVADAEAAKAAMAEIIARWGCVDGVVNNAGIVIPRAFTELEPAAFERQIQANLYGAFNMAHAAAPHFKQQERGAFVHFTSSVGLIGSPGVAGYAASKAGLLGLSRTLSFDMAKFNVRSNCIAPAAATRMTTSGDDTSEMRAYAARMQRHAPPEKIAPLVLFLLSDAAADVTGQIFGCCGDTIFLYDQPRPTRIAQRGSGWTAETIARDILPGWRSSLVPLESNFEIFYSFEGAE